LLFMARLRLGETRQQPKKENYTRQENDFYCSHGHDCIVARAAVLGPDRSWKQVRTAGALPSFISWGLPRSEGDACAELAASRRNRDTIALGSGVYLSEIGSSQGNPRCAQARMVKDVNPV
jgi:hypothetical protein